MRLLELRTVGTLLERVMGLRNSALAGVSCVLACGGLSSAQAATGIVIGDSLGVGLAEVSHLKNFAHISVHIRGPKAVAQIRGAPEGATAFVVLGTNDANGSIARLDKSIDDILDAADQKHMRLVWIGPPCVHQSWDTRSRELDQILAAKLPPRGVTYVPMRDPGFCNAGLHEPDGVHLKNKGYLYMWDKARRIAGFGAPAATAVAAQGSQPANRDVATTGSVLAPPATKFELAASPAANSGGHSGDEPKVYVLRVKRGSANAQTN
jgi:hypothetical protein